MKEVNEVRLFRFSLFGFCSVLTIVGLQLLPSIPARAQGDAPEAAPRTRREVRREAREGTTSAAAQQTKRAWIGIQLQDRDDQSGQADDDKGNAADNSPAKKNEQGVAVTAVYPNGPAAHAGVRIADRIQSINGKAVSASKDVTETIGALQPATKAQIVVTRQGTEQTLTVVLGDAAAFHPQQGQPKGQGNPQGNGFGQTSGYPQGTFTGHEGVPEHAMMLEYNRRNAEQHQRMESQIEELLQEVKSLRKEVQALKAK